MAFIRVALLAALCSGASATAATSETRNAANPIRRVVSMMQGLQKKIVEEGERDQELYDKFMCYCKNGASDLQASIDAAETKNPKLQAAIEEAKGQKEQLEADLKQHKADRDSAKEAVATATALREKEAAAYAKTSSDFVTNVAAMKKAIAALEKGAGTGFLQTSTGAVLRQLVVTMDSLSSTDRDVLSSFLSTSSGYAPQSGAITGILKQMLDTMEKDLSDATAAEEEAKTNFEGLVAAKEKEIAANSEAIEEKTKRLGEVGVSIVTMEEDLDDTTKALAEDKKFLADMDKNCATKEEEFDLVKKTRGEELLALADTIKILNDDDALDLFKKTLPSASLLQVQVSSKTVKRAALKALAGHNDARLDLISMAIKGKKFSFDKVLKMIDDMVVLLGKEQKDDEAKKAYCEKEIDTTEDEVKELDLQISDLEKAIEDAKEQTAVLAEEIKALIASVKALDKSVAEATEQRQAENSEYKETMQGNNAAKELLSIAKNRLNKFYNPTQYKAPPKRELSEEDRIAVNMGGEAPPTEAPGGIAGTGVTAFVQLDDTVAPPPPPEAVGAYKKKGQESAGILTLIDMLVADLDKEIQELTVDEKDAQADYEKFIEDSAEKRTQDTKSIEDKESAKADLETKLVEDDLAKKDKLKEAYNTALTLKDLHLECDWLLSNFDARKEARVGEVDSLKKAKAVLSGADYSLVQISEHTVRTV